MNKKELQLALLIAGYSYNERWDTYEKAGSTTSFCFKKESTHRKPIELRYIYNLPGYRISASLFTQSVLWPKYKYITYAMAMKCINSNDVSILF